MVCLVLHPRGFPRSLLIHHLPSPLPKMDGPFQDIELLKSRPAHMTVFMRYIFTQLLDPNPLVSFTTKLRKLSEIRDKSLFLSFSSQICRSGFMFVGLYVLNSCFTCRWRLIWAPALKKLVHSHLRSAPISWTRMLSVQTRSVDLIFKQ